MSCIRDEGGNRCNLESVSIGRIRRRVATTRYMNKEMISMDARLVLRDELEREHEAPTHPDKCGTVLLVYLTPWPGGTAQHSCIMHPGFSLG